MGCGLGKFQKPIKKATAIEVLNEIDYKLDPQNVQVVNFKLEGKPTKLYFRPLCYKIQPR